MGIVYEAEQQDPHRRVALKVVRGGLVDERSCASSSARSRPWRGSSHPNIAAIYEAGRTDDGEHFFAMELVHGETLARRRASSTWAATRPARAAAARPAAPLRRRSARPSTTRTSAASSTAT